tara:strand:- start:975 stop:1394 length:420 start_codon:yes stop_codon:yes gene_type:complete
MDIGLLKQLDNNQVIFFDGYCNLCSSLLDFISSKDIATRFAFIPLQSELALQVLVQNGYPVEKIKNLENAVYLRQHQLKTKSDAILAILWDLGGIYRLSYALYLIPGFIRNQMYSFIAKSRYRWFGKRKTCRLPTSDRL